MLLRSVKRGETRKASDAGASRKVRRPWARRKVIGYRCLRCNYSRDSFAGLTPLGQADLEAGLCTACGETGLALIFQIHSRQLPGGSGLNLVKRTRQPAGRSNKG